MDPDHPKAPPAGASPEAGLDGVKAPGAVTVEGLGARALLGFRWTSLATATGALGQVLYTVVMARLVSPAAFGLVAMTQVAFNFFGYLARLGLREAVIQKPQLTDRDLRAAFTLSLGFGVGVGVLVIVAAGPIAALLGDPAAAPLLRVVAVGFLAISLGEVPEALLQRHLRFRLLSLLSTGSFLLGYLGIGVPLAMAGAQEWALIAAIVGSNVLYAVPALFLVRHPKRPVADARAYRALLGYGSRVSLAGFGEFIGSNLDTFAVGRYAGTAPVGQYGRAFNIVSVPLNLTAESLSSVVLPSFSAIQDDLVRLCRAGVSTMSAFAVVLVPATAGIAVLAPSLVLVLLGPEWSPAALVVPPLAAAAALNVLSRVPVLLCEARAALNVRLGVQASHLVVLACGLFAAAGGGLRGYALALLGAELFRHVLYLGVSRRLVGLPLGHLLASYGAAVLVAAIGAAAALLPGMLSDVLDLPITAAFLVQSASGSAAVLLALRFGGGPVRWVREDLRGRLLDAGIGAGGASARALRMLVGPGPAEGPAEGTGGGCG